MTQTVSWPIKRGRLSAEEIASLEAYAAAGLKPSRVAQKLGRHPATINWQFIIRGLKDSAPRYAAKPYKRGGVLVVPFSRDEDVFLTTLRVQDCTCSQIAELCRKRFGHRRSPHTILMRLKMLANVEAG